MEHHQRYGPQREAEMAREELMNISRTLITEHNAHGKSDQEIVLCEKKLEMYSPSRRAVTKAAESKKLITKSIQ